MRELKDLVERLVIAGWEPAARAAYAVAAWSRRLHWEEGRPLVSGADSVPLEEDHRLYDGCLHAIEEALSAPSEETRRLTAQAADAVRYSGRSSNFLFIARYAALQTAGYDLFFTDMQEPWLWAACLHVRHALGYLPPSELIRDELPT